MKKSGFVFIGVLFLASHFAAYADPSPVQFKTFDTSWSNGRMRTKSYFYRASGFVGPDQEVVTDHGMRLVVKWVLEENEKTVTLHVESDDAVHTSYTLKVLKDLSAESMAEFELETQRIVRNSKLMSELGISHMKLIDSHPQYRIQDVIVDLGGIPAEDTIVATNNDWRINRKNPVDPNDKDWKRFQRTDEKYQAFKKFIKNLIKLNVLVQAETLKDLTWTGIDWVITDSGEKDMVQVLGTRYNKFILSQAYENFLSDLDKEACSKALRKK